ncbi:MAG: hypothetical protein PHI48_01645 [Bacteroidales bacterium]|nr:hypothetical protein [Bacteroidales bacterium]MDD4821251.1 hypothetical protein [Bacteroidales bacterium]
MYKHLCLTLVAAMLLVFSSCSKKMGGLTSDYFTTTPEVLEEVAGEVPVTINGKFPAKFFNKKAIVTVTPVLAYNGGEAYGESTTFQGEKVEGNNKTISYSEGGLFTMKTSFKYKDVMAKSELYLEFTAKIGKKEVKIPRVKIADGVISTALLSSAASSTPAIAPDKFQRIIKEAHQANIMFLIQQAELRASELKGQSVKGLKEKLADASKAENKKVTSLEISSYASPDGGLDLNEKLAAKREKVSTDFMNKELKKANVKTEVEGKFTAEDWDGFKELVEKSNIQDKEIIVRVLSMYSDPEEREREIKNISVAYKDLADEILPQLRRSKLTLNVEIIGKSDDQILQLAKYTPTELTVDEILYAATLVDTDAEKVAIYKKTAELFPADYRAVNNIGVISFKEGDFETAQSQFEKAAKINANAPEVNMNKALLSLKDNNAAAAKTLLGKATGVKELEETMGLMYIQTGDYKNAVKAFDGVKSNNAALAFILNKDYNKAKTILNEIAQPDATTGYLSAIVGARTNNASMVIEGLKASAAKDATVARKALTDIEFAKFVTNADFLKIVK